MKTITKQVYGFTVPVSVYSSLAECESAAKGRALEIVNQTTYDKTYGSIVRAAVLAAFKSQTKLVQAEKETPDEFIARVLVSDPVLKESFQGALNSIPPYTISIAPPEPAPAARHVAVAQALILGEKSMAKLQAALKAAKLPLPASDTVEGIAKAVMALEKASDPLRGL